MAKAIITIDDESGEIEVGCTLESTSSDSNSGYQPAHELAKRITGLLWEVSLNVVTVELPDGE